MTDDQVHDFYRLVLVNLRDDFKRLKDTIDGLSFKLDCFRRTYGSLKNLSSLIPENHELKSDIEDYLDVYTPDFLTGLDDEQFQTIDEIEEFVKTQYDIGKYEGREAVALFRKVLKSGKFSPGYLAEFDSRF